MSVKESTPPIFIIAGFVAPLIFLVCWIAAAAIDGKWDITVNSLSDLGVCGTPASEILFNYGCVLSGLAGAIFGLGMVSNEKGKFRLSGISVMIAVVFLMGIGVITKEYLDPHKFVGFVFAGFSVLAIVLSAWGDWEVGRKAYFVFPIVLMTIVVLCFPIKFVYFGVYEALAIISVLIWFLVQAHKYYVLSKTHEYIL